MFKHFLSLIPQSFGKSTISATSARLSLTTVLKPVTLSKQLVLTKQLVLAALVVGAVVGIPGLPEPIVRSALAQGTIDSDIEYLRRSNQRWIQVDLSSQRLIAWQGNQQIHAVIISTGKAGNDTPLGTFSIQSKHRTARMQGEDYDVPDVPFTMYYSGNYAIHGAYWHHQFGTRVSHGCINVAVDHAEWLYHWASVGTPVVVQG
jgi:lipoprotein-anchoring transpeptidase ErfK/SrfK